MYRLQTGSISYQTNSNINALTITSGWITCMTNKIKNTVLLNYFQLLLAVNFLEEILMYVKLLKITLTAKVVLILKHAFGLVHRRLH